MMNINQHEDKATNPEPCHPSGRAELLTYECLCFILGDASGWEYGVPENIGWIDTIGVDPSFQKKGMARMLIEEMLNYMKKVGVDTVYTFVNWRDWGLLQFFDAMGFRRGDMINLEFNIED